MASFVISTFSLSGPDRAGRIWICPYCGQENDYLYSFDNSSYIKRFNKSADIFYCVEVQCMCHFCKKVSKLRIRSEEEGIKLETNYSPHSLTNIIKNYSNRTECKHYYTVAGSNIKVDLLANCCGLEDRDITRYICILPEKELAYRLENPESLVLKGSESILVRARTYKELVLFIDLTLSLCRQTLKVPIDFSENNPIIIPASFNDSVLLVRISHTNNTNYVTLESVPTQEDRNIINAKEVFVYNKDAYSTFWLHIRRCRE